VAVLPVPPRVPERPRATVPVFRDCPTCPELVALPGGTFTMGSNDDPSEKPPHSVTIGPFAIGRFPVTVGEWRECSAAKACNFEPSGDPDRPVSNISWNDAQQYVGWLSKITQQTYRLLTEAEWEFAARAGTATKYWWGNQLTTGMANCRGCNEPYDAQEPVKVGSFPPNALGLHDMAGGVSQWVSDCWHRDYQGAPRDGSSWDSPDCREHVLRGGSWRNDSSYARVTNRERYDTGVRYPTHGLRVARSQKRGG
jgi:formylglycine-generating enzyme required for sulfatase activity